MRNAVIAGVGMTPFGKYLDRSLRSLADEAVDAALSDAHCDASFVDAVFFGNSAAGVILEQDMIRGQVALRGTKVAGKPIFNVENACASGSSAVHLAQMMVKSGQADVVLAVGAEKLAHADKTRSFAALARGVDQSELRELMEGNGGKSSVFMDIYAAKTRQYMEKTGASVEDFAGVAVKSRHAASLNPVAQFREPVTIEEVLNSRRISDPLTLMMCSGIGDGAAAVVVMTEEKAKEFGADYVHIRASCVVSANADGGGASTAVRATRKAYEQAGVSPKDIHVAEVHDASAPAEIMVYETVGFCGPGEGSALFRSGATGLNGRISVNPSGGLLGRGHPVGATGAAQIVELANQLRGRCGPRQREGAKLALAENAGGQIGPDAAVAVVTILSA